MAEDFAKGIGAFPSVSVDIIVSNDFADKCLEMTLFLSNYRNHDASGCATAIWFLKNIQSLWSSWDPIDIYDKVMASLD